MGTILKGHKTLHFCIHIPKHNCNFYFTSYFKIKTRNKYVHYTVYVCHIFQILNMHVQGMYSNIYATLEVTGTGLSTRSTLHIYIYINTLHKYLTCTYKGCIQIYMLHLKSLVLAFQQGAHYIYLAHIAEQICLPHCKYSLNGKVAMGIWTQQFCRFMPKNNQL